MAAKKKPNTKSKPTSKPKPTPKSKPKSRPTAAKKPKAGPKSRPKAKTKTKPKTKTTTTTFELDLDDAAPGWDAIDAVFDRLYPKQEPMHWGTLLSALFGGSDPLQGISAYRTKGKDPHWHYVSYGMSELYAKEGEDPDVSGWGFEFTFRLRARKGEKEPPAFVTSVFNNLARYVFATGNVFEPGHHMTLNGPILLDDPTLIRAALFAEDPQCPAVDTPNGKLKFVQIVGATEDELAAAQAWNTEGVLGLLRKGNPQLVTDLDRQSVLDKPATRKAAAAGRARDGSSTGVQFVPDLKWKPKAKGGGGLLTMGASAVRFLPDVLRGRVPFGRSLALVSKNTSVTLAPAGEAEDDAIVPDAAVIELTAEQATELADVVRPVRGDYELKSFPGLTVRVTPSKIKDADGKVAEVIG